MHRTAAAIALVAACSASAQPTKSFQFAMPPLDTNFLLGSAVLQGAEDFAGGEVIEIYADIVVDVDPAPDGAGFVSDASFFTTEIILPIDTDPSTPGVQAPGVVITGADLGWSGTGRFSARVPVSQGVGGEFAVPLLFTATTTATISPTEILLGQLREAQSGWTLIVRRPTEECGLDFNGDGQLTPADFSAFLMAYRSGDLATDLNGDGVVTPADVAEFFQNYARGCRITGGTTAG